MFTGLVEEIGTVTEVHTSDATVSGGGTTLTISVPANASSGLLSDARLGDSISVNGVCLTVTTLSSDRTAFTIGVAPETLRVTNLGALRVGDAVNLERAVRADTRLGGHFVQGHVDAVAEIVDVRPDGEALVLRFRPSVKDGGKGAGMGMEVLRYIVYKGYVALDGTSLTVTRVDDAEGWWEVMLIAYTQQKVVLAQKKKGDSVNVEVDILAKYAEKAMMGYSGALIGEGGAGAPGQGGNMLAQMIERIVERKMR